MTESRPRLISYNGETLHLPWVEAFVRDYLALCRRYGLHFNTGDMGDQAGVERLKGLADLYEDGTTPIHVMKEVYSDPGPEGVEPPGRTPITGAALVVRVETFNTMNHEEVFTHLIALARHLTPPARLESGQQEWTTVIVNTQYAGLEISATAQDSVPGLVGDLRRRLAEKR